MGLALTGLLTAITQVGMGFEREMKAVRAVSQATEEEFKNLSEAALDVGKNTQFTARQAAEGLKFLAMAGFDATTAVEALPGVVDLATVGFMDLGQAADIATNILTAYTLEASELSNVNDILAKMATTSNTTIEQAAEAFKYAAPLANTFKMSVADTATVFGLLANAGIRGSQAGTTLAQMMRKLANTTRETEPILDKYGITIRDKMTGAVKPFMEVIMEVAEAGMSVEESAKLLGVRATLMQAIFSRGTPAIKKYKETIYDASGAAQSMAEMIRSDFSFQVLEIKSKLEELAIFIYERLKPGLSELATGIKAVVDTTRIWFERNDEQIMDKIKKSWTGIFKAVKTGYDWLTSLPGKMLQLGVVGTIMFGAGGPGLILATIPLIVKAWKTLKETIFNKTDMELTIAHNNKVIEQLEKQKKTIQDTIKWGKFGGKYNPFGLSAKEVKRREAAIIALENKIEARKQNNAEMQNQVNKNKLLNDQQREENDLGRKWNDILEDQISNQERLQKIRQYEAYELKMMKGRMFQGSLGKAGSGVGDKEDPERAAEARNKKWMDENLYYWKEYYKILTKMQEENAKKQEELINNVASATGNSMQNMVESIWQGSFDAKAIFTDLAKSIIAELWKVYVMEQIVGLVSKGVKAIMPGGSFWASGNYDPGPMGGPSGVYHEGGVVGQSNVPQRLVRPSVFANAKRMHNGGAVGNLGPNEVPIIAEKGERIIPAGQSVGTTVNNYYDLTNAVMNREEFEAQMQRQAAEISEKIAPGAVERNYKSDGVMRDLIRGRR